MWALGAVVFFLLALIVGVAAFAVAVPFGILSEVFGWGDGLSTWLAVTACVWLPLAIGYMCNQQGFRSIRKCAEQLRRLPIALTFPPFANTLHGAPQPLTSQLSLTSRASLRVCRSFVPRSLGAKWARMREQDA